MLKFPHFPEQILQKVDNESLFKVREVARSWKNIIDGRNYPWIRLVNIPMILTLGNTYLHLSAAKGQIEVFKAALSKEEDKNVANEFGETFFHLVCRNGHLNIVELLLKTTNLEVDFDTNSKYGYTGISLIDGWCISTFFFETF